MFTPEGVVGDRLSLTFEIPLSSARAAPSLPRVARFDHQAIGLVIVYSAAVFVAAAYREAVKHPL
jgi:hypothetical protein